MCDKELLGRLRLAAEARLSAPRLAHTLGVEAEALRLAAHHGLSEEETAHLRAAALLHDITKELSPEDHLKLCEKWDILLDCETVSCPAVLHQFTGAAVAAREFALPEAVCAAIRTHTTGGWEMDAIARILYLADLLEPGRPFAGNAEICERSGGILSDGRCDPYFQASEKPVGHFQSGFGNHSGRDRSVQYRA